MENLRVIELHDAEARFPELVGRVEDGEEVLIARDGRPAALLVGLSDEQPPEVELVWEGEISLTLDADLRSR